MVTLYDLATRAAAEGGETVLGAADLETHACYLMYGVVEVGAAPRLLNPGNGHEEIICVVAGNAALKGPGGVQEMAPGQAFHLVGEAAHHLENRGSVPVVYVVAGGHSAGHGHHHH